MRQANTDLRHEIPARAFINAQIIQKMWETDLFKETIKAVINEKYSSQGLTEYEFGNSAYVASLLYCLIVIPKEKWANSPQDIIYSKLNKLNSRFTIGKTNGKPCGSPMYQLIHRLRNAIAHANFSVDEKMVFKFWDMHPGRKETEWEAIIDSQKLLIFLSEVGSILASEGLTN